MVAGIAVLALISDPVILLIFGGQFAGAAALLRVICIGLCLNVIAHPYSATLFALNRPQVFPVSSAVSMTVFAIANLVLIPVIGVMGAAIAFTLHSIALLAVVLFYYRRWRDTLPTDAEGAVT
jgi:O-antigen/teichoic acid export membrane protein